MKKYSKMTSIILTILLMLQIIFPVITHIEISTSNAVTIQSINNTTAILEAGAVHKEVFSKIGRYKFNYTGASNCYYDTNPNNVNSKGYSKLGLTGIESDHNENHGGNSSGAKLTISSGSSIKKAYLVMQYNESSESELTETADWYVTLSYNATKQIANFTPSSSIKFKPTNILHNTRNKSVF